MIHILIIYVNTNNIKYVITIIRNRPSHVSGGNDRGGTQ
jgi:hypothetical protein